MYKETREKQTQHSQWARQWRVHVKVMNKHVYYRQVCKKANKSHGYKPKELFVG